MDAMSYVIPVHIQPKLMRAITPKIHAAEEKARKHTNKMFMIHMGQIRSSSL